MWLMICCCFLSWDFLYCCLHNHKTNEQNRSYSLLPEIQDLESCVCARSHQSVQEVAFIIHLFTNETYLHFSWSWIWGLYLSKKSTEWHPSLGCNTSLHLLKFLRKTCNSHGLKLQRDLQMKLSLLLLAAFDYRLLFLTKNCGQHKFNILPGFYVWWFVHFVFVAQNIRSSTTFDLIISNALCLLLWSLSCKRPNPRFK